MHRLPALGFLACLATALVSTSTRAEDVPPPTPTAVPTERVQEVAVIGRARTYVGRALTASQGEVGAAQLDQRPLLRPGEVLEAVPGLIATQHSGSGKANQFFLRGFNLDHGTDFLTSIDGVPVNLPTHGHGHGYTDLNFLIPELIDSVEFKKGVYFADTGDFSSAGSSNIRLKTELDEGIVSFTTGSYSFNRMLVADSKRIGEMTLLYATELQYYDGPWDVEEDYGKVNSLVRLSGGTKANGYSLTANVYHGEWTSTDQIPARAVASGRIGRLGTVDPSDGGLTTRAGLSFDWHREDATSVTQAVLYGYYYNLNLYSNFTYFLDDPVRGDQFEQLDERVVSGGAVSHTIATELFELPSSFKGGFQLRNDLIPSVGLYNTTERVRHNTVRDDDVKQGIAGVYLENTTQLAEKVKTVFGARGDVILANVDSNIDANSGSSHDTIVSPKGSLIVGPWEQTEFYLSGGTGFHSNDARGSTITVNPTDTSETVQPVNLLVRSKGAEVGARTAAVKGLVSTASLWMLDLDSELLFIGDAGTTEATRPSRRYGVELTNYYAVNDWLSLDADLSISHARFKDNDPAGRRIPGSPEAVFASGVSVQHPDGYFGSFRSRYFGPRPLVEDDSERSASSLLFNGEIGYRWGRWSLALQSLNIFDRKASDIDYFYTSRLRGEPASGVDDRHFHPAEPRSTRLQLVARF